MSAAHLSSDAIVTDSAPVRPGGGPSTLREAVVFFVRQASPRILITLLSISLVARVVEGGWSSLDVIPVLCLLVYWPLNEWLIHVFVLHAKPFHLAGRVIDPAAPRKHRAHHRDPWNLEILFIPVESFFFALPLVAFLCFILTPTTALALTAVATFLALSLRYEWIHFISHTGYRPSVRHAQRLVHRHRLHHFKNEHYWFGVSMIAADLALRTSPRAEDVETSETCRTLGVDRELA